MTIDRVVESIKSIKAGLEKKLVQSSMESLSSFPVQKPSQAKHACLKTLQNFYRTFPATGTEHKKAFFLLVNICLLSLHQMVTNDLYKKLIYKEGM